MNTLTADALTLEPQTAAHAEAMFEVLSDPAIYEFDDEPPASAQSLHERFEMLETRQSPDGSEHWLNWVIRDPSGDLVGYVQAGADYSGNATIAYVLGSRWWGRGYARRAVEAMIDELATTYGVRRLMAVFKTENFRSRRLLERLGFRAATADECAYQELEADESKMVRAV